jgi:hypothetical protein
MVDARMLDHLSKKELEKFLGVTRKFHQASVVHGIHLLRMMKYDRQVSAGFCCFIRSLYCHFGHRNHLIATEAAGAKQINKQIPTEVR